MHGDPASIKITHPSFHLLCSEDQSNIGTRVIVTPNLPGYKVGVFHDDNNEMYTDIVYSPDGKSVVVGCRSGEVYPDNKIYAIDVESSQKTKLTVKAKHGNRVQALHWGQDGLFSLGWDNVLYRWDINLDHPVLNCFCPCSNKDAACFTGGLLFAGIVHPQDNLQVLDLNSGKILSKSTVKSNQAALNLGSNDFGCEVQILKQVRFDPNLFIVATSHNDTLKIMKLEGQKMTEVYAWESLPSQVFSLETSALRRRIFCGGKQFQTSLDFGSA